MAGAERDPIERARGVLELVVAQLEPRIESLRAEERELATRIEAGKARVEGLQEVEHLLKGRKVELEAEVETLRRRQGETAADVARLEAERARVEAQVARLQDHLVELTGQQERLAAEIAEIRERVAAERERLLGEITGLESRARQVRAEAQAEIDRLQAGAAEQRQRLEREHSDLLQRVSDLRLQVVQGEAGAQLAQQAAESAREQAAEARRQLDGLRASIHELQEMKDTLTGQVQGLKQHYEQLQREGRPLLPYRPSASGLTRAYFDDVKFGNKLPRLDWKAVEIYSNPASGAGLPITKILVEALRNYLPHSAYERAIDDIREELLEQAQPAEKEIDRVPPTGAGATGPAEKTTAE